MLNSLIKISGKKLLLPLYHAISDQAPAHLRNLYLVRTIESFKSELEYILKYFKPIDVPELVEYYKKDQSIQENRVLFTFDDGLREIADVVAPLFIQKGIPAVFFVNSGFVDNKDLFYRYKASVLIEKLKHEKMDWFKLKSIATILNIKRSTLDSINHSILNVDYLKRDILDQIADILEYKFQDYLKYQKPYLTTDELIKLQNDGFYIGAHSMDHPEYFKIPFEEQLKQTLESINWVKEQFNPEFNLFAFPFTDFNISKRFFETVFSNKELGLDLSFGCAGLKDEDFENHLQRIPFEKSAYSAKSIIYQEYVAYITKKLIAKNRIKR